MKLLSVLVTSCLVTALNALPVSDNSQAISVPHTVTRDVDTSAADLVTRDADAVEVEAASLEKRNRETPLERAQREYNAIRASLEREINEAAQEAAQAEQARQMEIERARDAERRLQQERNSAHNARVLEAARAAAAARAASEERRRERSLSRQRAAQAELETYFRAVSRERAVESERNRARQRQQSSSSESSAEFEDVPIGNVRGRRGGGGGGRNCKRGVGSCGKPNTSPKAPAGPGEVSGSQQHKTPGRTSSPPVHAAPPSVHS